MHIAMATEGPRITPASLDRPLGGTEASWAGLVQAFVRRGHEVEVFSGDGPRESREGATWHPLGAPPPFGADLVIANRVPRLFRGLPARGRRVLWLFNPCRYLRKPRHFLPLLRTRPVAVTLGSYHASTLPRWMPVSGRAQLPLCVTPPFDTPPPPRAAAPPPVAVFASNPLRGLDWLLELWATRIAPAVPGAELHLYTGAGTYGGDARLAARAAPVLEWARALADAGVVLHAPSGREGLARAYAGARAMLYRGDPGETYCLSLGEAQAAGLPCVVTPLGSVPERVVDGETGVVARNDAAFATAAIRLLTDDAAWRAMHEAALARGPGPSWDAVAARFEALAG